MLTRREFLRLTASVLGMMLVPGGDLVPARRLLSASRGGGSVVSSVWGVDGAASILTNLALTFSNAEFTVDDGVDIVEGYRPAAIYDALWTRDNAYCIWHHPHLFTAAQRRDFVSYYLARRTTGAEADPDGGTLPPDFIADRIGATGVATYKNAGASDLPFMDGIHFVVLALWTDWHLTGDDSTFTANQSAINDCLEAIPRSANGCVYSDPSAPSVDYGFTDTIKKTGDVAYGTALQAWAYKMCADMAGENGSGTYSALRAGAQAGLATLRKSSGWYAGSSGNNASRDDVWATALIVAEGLATRAERLVSAQTIADAYLDGSDNGAGYESTISEFGLVRHLPAGQFWAGTSTAQGTYQNGGFWLTPLWDIVRAVDMVNPTLARSWAAEAMGHLKDEFTTEGTWADVPWEWHNYPGLKGAEGYSPSAAIVQRFI